MVVSGEIVLVSSNQLSHAGKGAAPGRANIVLDTAAPGSPNIARSAVLSVIVRTHTTTTYFDASITLSRDT
jgi:hypothetical protein